MYNKLTVRHKGFVNNNLPRIPKGLNVNNRPVQQDGLTVERLPNSEGVECGNHF